MSDLTGIDHSRVGHIAERLVAHGETIAISESSAGGLISAALLSVPGASAYFLGGGVIYTRKAMGALLELTPAKLGGYVPPPSRWPACSPKPSELGWTLTGV